MGLLAAIRRRRFLTAAERAQIAAALAGIPRHTTARVDLCIDQEASADPQARAESLFRQWNLPQPEHARAILVYISAVSRNFALVGGEEIRRVAPQAFWEAVRRDLHHHVVERRFCDGIFKALAQVTVQLQHHFPRAADNPSEGRAGAAESDGGNTNAGDRPGRR